jgi:hypothetical protein
MKRYFEFRAGSFRITQVAPASEALEFCHPEDDTSETVGFTDGWSEVIEAGSTVPAPMSGSQCARFK